MKAYSYVRWSSAQQTSGDSRRRQTDLAAAWSTKHKVQLDNSTYQDHGVSAFKGKNVAEGKLGAFLKAIDEGHIETPCYLLVEDIDRLTRDVIDLGLELLLSMIRRGVTIVTLQTEQVYSPEKIRSDGGLSLITVIMKLQGAHEYSQKLGKRVKEAWDAKREQRSKGVIATKIGPSWLKLGDDGKWKVINAKANVVKRIFKMAMAGNGVHTIADTLNKERVPNIGTRRRRNDAGELVERENHWTTGNVSGLFRSECVFGRWRSADGKHYIDNYYEPIVTKADYDAIKRARDKRRGTGGFKQGTTNLFSRLTRCAYCGKALKIRRYKGIYVQCRNSLYSACTAKRIAYDVLESEVLSYLMHWMKRDLNPQKMDESNKSRRRQLQQIRNEKQAELERLLKVVKSTKTYSPVFADAVDEAQLELNKATDELAKLSGQPLTGKDVDDAVELFYNLTEENTKELRMEVMVRLRDQIKHIDVAPHLEDHPKHFKMFGIEKKPTSPLHMVKIIYADDSVGITDVITG